MKNLSIGLKIAVGFTIILVLFIVMGTILHNILRNLQDDTKWVSHTHEVINNIGEIQSNLKDAETGQRGYLITGDNKYLEPYNNAKENIMENITTLKNLTSDNPNQQNRIIKVRQLVSQKMAELDETITLRREKGFEDAQKIVITDLGKKIMGEFRLLTNEMLQEEYELLKIRNDISIKSSDRASLIILVMTSIAGVITLILVFLYIRSIAMPISNITLVAEKIAKGDLNSTIHLDGRNDEIGKLNRAFYEMQKNLRSHLKEITMGVNTLAASTTEFLASISQISSGASETATSINETTSTLNEVKQTAAVANEKSKEVSESAEESLSFAQNGNKVIQDSLEGMQGIKEQMNSLTDIVIGLSEKGQFIGEIIDSVNDLAEQSNLLAVNASVEAARAGDYGKGFNVVAQEIKSLAQQSKESTQQIRKILDEIQIIISKTVLATEQGSKTVDNGLKLSVVSQEVIEKLTENIDDFTQVALQISASSHQQMIGMDQINDAMISLTEASSETASSTKQSENSVIELQNLGETLKNIVSKYEF